MSINENSIVEKSRFLLGMKAPNYELGELKILDTYLARINARDPKTQAVTFTKEEYEGLMGFTDSRPETLKKRTEGLLGKIVTVPLEDGKKGWRKLTLFTKAECVQDDFGGYVVHLNCNPELQPLFFNVESAGYLRYRLKNILPLTSKYSMLLYLLLKDNIFRSPFDVDLKELKLRLGITTKRYDEFKHLRAEIVDKAIEEINKKTDIVVSYERKTRGRTVVGLVFTVKNRPSELPKPEPREEESNPQQITVYDMLADPALIEAREKRDEICAGFDDELFDEFSDDQLRELRSCAWEMVNHDDVVREHAILGDLRLAKEFVVSAYIRRKILMCNARGNEINSRYGFIKNAVTKDYQ